MQVTFFHRAFGISDENTANGVNYAILNASKVNTIIRKCQESDVPQSQTLTTEGIAC